MLILKWVLVFILLMHGAVHLLGGFSELHIAGFNNLSGETLVALAPSLKIILGVVWILVTSLFVLSAIGLACSLPWWKSVAATALVLSQILLVLWWPDAKWGTVINLLIVGGLFIIK